MRTGADGLLCLRLQLDYIPVFLRGFDAGVSQTALSDVAVDLNHVVLVRIHLVYDFPTIRADQGEVSSIDRLGGGFPR